MQAGDHPGAAGAQAFVNAAANVIPGGQLLPAVFGGDAFGCKFTPCQRLFAFGAGMAGLAAMAGGGSAAEADGAAASAEAETGAAEVEGTGWGDPDQVFVRRGKYWESQSKLAKDAANAEATTNRATGENFPHGVSVTPEETHVARTGNSQDAGRATRSAIEDAGFQVVHTPTNNDPTHHTLVLPNHLSADDARQFNGIFGRRR